MKDFAAVHGSGSARCGRLRRRSEPVRFRRDIYVVWRHLVPQLGGLCLALAFSCALPRLSRGATNDKSPLDGQTARGRSEAGGTLKVVKQLCAENGPLTLSQMTNTDHAGLE